MMKRRSTFGFHTAIALLLSGVVTLFVPVSAGATTMVYLSLNDLYQRSDLVVRGTIQSHTSFWTDEGQMFTDWTLRVDEVLYGESLAVLTFRQMGGEVDGRRLRVEGDAQFEDGEQVVLFLVQDEGIYYLTALGQSKLSVSLQGGLGAPGDVLQVPSPSLDRVQATLVRELGGLVFYSFSEEEGGSLYQMDDEILTLEDLRRMSPSYQPVEAGGGER